MGFDVSKWNKQRYLAEAGITQEVEIDALHDLLYNADPSYSNLAKAIAKFLKGTEEDTNSGFSKDQINDFMKILHTELGIEPLNEEVTYDTYNVKVIPKDPSEGGPSDEWEDTKIKVDSSLKGEAIKSSIMDTLNDMGYNIHSITYNKV